MVGQIHPCQSVFQQFGNHQQIIGPRHARGTGFSNQLSDSLDLTTAHIHIRMGKIRDRVLGKHPAIVLFYAAENIAAPDRAAMLAYGQIKVLPVPKRCFSHILSPNM